METFVLENQGYNLLQKPQELTFEETNQVSGGCPPCVIVGLKYAAGAVGFAAASFTAGFIGAAGADAWKHIYTKYFSRGNRGQN